MGLSIFVTGTDDVGTDNDNWYHRYYQLTNGNWKFSLSTGIQNGVKVFARRR